MDRQLPDALIETLQSHGGLGKSRLETFAVLVLGLVNARTVNLSHLAGQFSGSAQIASSYRRLQRFFQYVTLDGDWLAMAVVDLLKLRQPWLLALDRTAWKIGQHDVNILMLAVVTRRVRVPLMWTVLDKAGVSSTTERIALVQRYLDMFGASSIRLLLCDREFSSYRWLEFLLKNNVLFAIRVKEGARVVLDDGRQRQLIALLRKQRSAAALAAHRGHFHGMTENAHLTLRFAAKRLADGQHLIIATNSEPAKALTLYRKRWHIECLFGDSKTRGLNMEDTRLTNPTKLNSLLVIITLAMTWAYATATRLMGCRAIKKGNHGYRIKSWFRCGFDQLRKWILYQPDIAIAIWRGAWKTVAIAQNKKTYRVV